MGTLFIPNTLAIIKGAPHADAAQRLVDFLLQPTVEAKLAAGPSAQIPLNPNCKAEVRVATPQTIRAMQIDFDAAAEKWDAAAKFIRDEFTGGG
jgi:iron(III) transport system substrate-binding protein